MAQCELTGKGPVVKRLVSHSNIKTKFKAQPNVQQKQVYSSALNRLVTLKLATSTIRTIEHKGGFDAFILNQCKTLLSPRATKIRKQIVAKLTKPSAKAAK